MLQVPLGKGEPDTAESRRALPVRQHHAQGVRRHSLPRQVSLLCREALFFVFLTNTAINHTIYCISRTCTRISPSCLRCTVCDAQKDRCMSCCSTTRTQLKTMDDQAHDYDRLSSSRLLKTKTKQKIYTVYIYILSMYIFRRYCYCTYHMANFMRDTWCGGFGDACVLSCAMGKKKRRLLREERAPLGRKTKKHLPSLSTQLTCEGFRCLFVADVTQFWGS